MTWNRLVVVDLEATCWEGQPPQGEQSDIIEIGVTFLDLRSLELGESLGLMVKPARSTVSSFCTSLTGIRPEVVEVGLHLREAFDVLDKVHNTSKYPWASWGDYDRNMIQSSCKDLGLRNPLGRRHINLKLAWSLVYGVREAGMAAALQQSHIPLDGRHHCGKDDSRNIAKLAAHMFRSARRSSRLWEPPLSM